MAQGIDTDQNCTDYAGALYAAGIRFVCRYYSYDHHDKNLTAAEAAHLSQMGLYLVSVWEADGNHSSYFSTSQGTSDANAALAQAAACGQPAGTPIYFAADYDASQSDVDGVILEYFTAVDAVVKAAGYFAGVYGSGLTCSSIIGAGYASYSWLAMSTGYSGSEDYKNSNQWNILQSVGGYIAGINADNDRSNDDLPAGGGGWQVAPAAESG